MASNGNSAIDLPESIRGDFIPPVITPPAPTPKKPGCGCRGKDQARPGAAEVDKVISETVGKKPNFEIILPPGGGILPGGGVLRPVSSVDMMLASGFVGLPAATTTKGVGKSEKRSGRVAVAPKSSTADDDAKVFAQMELGLSLLPTARTGGVRKSDSLRFGK